MGGTDQKRTGYTSGTFRKYPHINFVGLYTLISLIYSLLFYIYEPDTATHLWYILRLRFLKLGNQDMKVQYPGILDFKT